MGAIQSIISPWFFIPMGMFAGIVLAYRIFPRSPVTAQDWEKHDRSWAEYHAKKKRIASLKP